MDCNSDAREHRSGIGSWESRAAGRGTGAATRSPAGSTTAATGHLHMIGGAIAHQFSSVLVIVNAMRLLRYK